MPKLTGIRSPMAKLKLFQFSPPMKRQNLQFFSQSNLKGVHKEDLKQVRVLVWLLLAKPSLYTLHET
jgi:hypothetical protein